MGRPPSQRNYLKMKIVKQRAAMYMFVTNGRFCVAKNVRSFVLFVRLSVCLFVCLSVCLFVCLSVCLFVRSFDDDECEQTKAFLPTQSDIIVKMKLFRVEMTRS